MKSPPRNAEGRMAAASGGKAELLGNRKSSADADAPQFRGRRAFIVWAVSCGFVKPERLTEEIVAELEREMATS
jgi:hypothetical protein